MNPKFVIYGHNPYHESNGGIMVLYYLAQRLKESGYETKFYNARGHVQNPFFNDTITLSELQDPAFDNENTVIIYCEGTIGNPLEKKKVVRWMLSELGLNVAFFYAGTWGKKELVYFFCSEVRFKNRPNSINSLYKRMNLIFLNPIFSEKLNYSREGFCHTYRKSHVHKKITPIHGENSFEMHRELKNDELKEIFNKYKYFVSYDPITYLNVIAAICGCISIVYPIEGCDKKSWLQKSHVWEYLQENNLGTNYYGIAYGMEDIQFAIDTMHLVEEQQRKINEYICSKAINQLISDIGNWDKNINTVQNVFFSKVSLLSLTYDNVKSCSYGFNDKHADITNKIKNYLREEKNFIIVNHDYIQTDPYFGREKKLFITMNNGDLYEVYENDYLFINYDNTKLIDMPKIDTIINCKPSEINGNFIYKLLQRENDIPSLIEAEKFTKFNGRYFILVKNSEIISYATVSTKDDIHLYINFEERCKEKNQKELLEEICLYYANDSCVLHSSQVENTLFETFGFQLDKNEYIKRNVTSVSLNTDEDFTIESIKTKNILFEKNKKEFWIGKSNTNKYVIKANKNRESKNIFVCFCRDGHYVYFKEYLESLNLFDIFVFYNKLSDLSSISYDNMIPVFIFDLDEDLFRFNLPKHVFILNMEQMSIQMRYNIVNQFYTNSYKLLDYSFAHQTYFPNAEILSYCYNEREINQLKSYFTGEYKYDICMIGCNSVARWNIFNELVKQGVKMVNAEGWNADRDRKVAESKILLNLHFQDNYQIYEHLRCDRWMFAGKLVISEKSQNSDKLLLENVYFYEYKNIVTECLRHLKEFDTIIIKSCENIITERNKSRIDFISKYDN